MESTDCAIVGYDESREVAVEYDSNGLAVDLKPVPGSHRVFINLRLPVGIVIRAEVSPRDFETVNSALQLEERDPKSGEPQPACERFRSSD